MNISTQAPGAADDAVDVDTTSAPDTGWNRAERLAQAGTGGIWIVVAAVLDVASILLFAFIGGRAHATDPSFWHVLEVAWPFLVGGLVGWGLSAAWRRPLELSGTAAIIWATTVIGGVALRALTLHGIAFTFIVITAGTLALFLFGWRAIVRAIVRRAARTAVDTSTATTR